MNIRNQPCKCGSGKKYKKCCLHQITNNISEVYSEELKNQLDKPCWYHGTEQHFNSWKFPPPKKPGEELLVPHSAVFFTSDLSFANGAGNKIAVSSLISKSKILDTTTNYNASEKLRKEVMKNQIASRTLNVTHDYWHEGWKSGAVLRMAHRSRELEAQLNNMISQLSISYNIPTEQAETMVYQNATRGLIELICIEAKNLGYDALFGHEIDRHSEESKIIAQPWLAIFTKGAVTDPEWIQ